MFLSVRYETFINLLLLTNLIASTFTQNITQCPSKCQCVRNVVRCLHQDLLVIPKAPRESHTLDVRFNLIFDIAPGALGHLPHLRSLLLNDNQLTELRSGSFHGLKRLVYLYLYRNRINHIDPDVFEGLQHLEQLYLHVNDIHHITAETFSNLPRLERLYLHNNKLQKVPAGSLHGLPRLRKLRLDSNALVCDCSILWLVRMLHSHQHMAVAATCYGPTGTTGAPLGSMTENDFNCRTPELMAEPEDIVVEFGNDALFTCSATGEPAPEIEWLHDSKKISLQDHRYEIMNNGTLMVYNADESNLGFFECMAKNDVGETRSRPARMTMLAKKEDSGVPVFILTPHDQQARMRQPVVTFHCKANGNPAPHISWYYNEERILLTDRISLKHNGTIVIENAQAGDTGTYTCVAENINGKIEASALLEVSVAPAFTSEPSDITVTVGDRVDYRCTARGSPKPVITWFKNTMTLPLSENVKLSDNNQNLTIVAATLDDDAIYHCRAENEEGLAEISATIKVDDYQIIKPHIIVKPQNTDAFKETTVQLPCETESEPAATIEWRKGGSRVLDQTRFTITLIGSLIIKNLTLADAEYYECTVFNEYGRDTAGAYLTVKDRILPGDEYVNIALVQATRDVDQAIEKTMKELFENNTATNVHDLFRISRFPNAGAREVARAAEIYERTLHKVQDFIRTGQSVTSAEPFDYHNVLSAQHLEVIARLSGCTAHREEKDCSDMCYHNKYRSIDGSCNNYAHPMWGSSLTGFRRILLPIYENGFSQPIGWNKEIKYNGQYLPGARQISSTIIKTEDISEDIEITHMAMQWGQWLDHDLDHGLPSVSSQTWDGIDCKKSCEYAAPCFPIDVPVNDTRVTNRRCIDFVRTSAVCGSGMTSALFGKLQPREQINQLTSFIDASQVYGFELQVAEDLRDLTNDNGMLRTGIHFQGQKPMLPTVGLNGMDCRRNVTESTRNCFVAGDIRANEQIGLVAMHTIWMREHNRIALELKSLNPFWDGDKVYHEARKVVGAEIQHITFDHWLPLIVGPQGYKQLGDYRGYNRNVNPSISNVFATAALRFGHSMINPVLHRYDENFETIPQGHLLLRHAFFAPWRLVDEGGVDPLIRGMFITPAKLKTPTQNLNSELTERLFETAHAVALDLAAINIQRGRDHAIPSYTKWREFCNMSEVISFDDLKNEISDKSVRDKLQKLYGTPQNIDVWVGGILEDQVQGGKVGPLFRCLLLEQFKRLRDGDRFWYENPSIFNSDQIHQIKEASLARVLCDNSDTIDTISEDVFFLPEVQDGMVACDDIPSIDFRFWADCETCGDEEESKSGTRSRRSVPDSKAGRYRFNKLSESQQELEKTVNHLLKRIEFLEENCTHD